METNLMTNTTEPSRQVKRKIERKEQKELKKKFPTAQDYDELRDALVGIGVTPLVSLKDVFMNHFQDQVDFGRGGKLKTEMKFTKDVEKFDRNDVYCLERMELDGTGLGMTPEIVEGEFSRRKLDRKESEGAGVWSIGEKLFWELMTERFPKLKELGVTVLTRIKGESKWYYRNWNPSGNDGKGEYKFQTELTTKEAMDKGLPVDKIGSHGSYIKSYICTEAMDDNWFDSLCATLNLYFSIPFRLTPERPNSGWWEATIIKDDKHEYIPVQTVELKGHVIPTEDSPIDCPKWKRDLLNYSGMPYEVNYGVRISQQDNVYSSWIQKYTEDLIGFGKVAEAVNITGTKNNKVGDNLVVMYIDKVSGIVYEVKVIQSGVERQNRGVMKVFVKKENVFVDVSKNVASLHGLKGHLSDRRERAKLLDKWTELIPIDVVKEQQLTDQMMDIFHGVKMPDSMHELVYEKFCTDFQVPAYDYEWGKKYVIPQFPMIDKKLDIMIKHPDNGNHVIENKRNEPNGDEDMNQVGFYAWGADATRVTTVGVSKKGQVGADINGGFKNEVRASFTSKLKNHPQFSHVDWQLIDLKYYDLHRVHTKFKKMPKREI